VKEWGVGLFTAKAPPPGVSQHFSKIDGCWALQLTKKN
jgi:hypothetical protein